MTTEWAETVIVAVKYNMEKAHISLVKILTYTGQTLKDERIVTRQDIVYWLSKKIRIITAYKKEDGKFYPGDEVEIFPVNDINYIKTEGDTIEKDNLGGLPEF